VRNTPTRSDSIRFVVEFVRTKFKKITKYLKEMMKINVMTKERNKGREEKNTDDFF
jgi:acid phosphatase class B